MQIQKFTLDGESQGISEVGGGVMTPKDYVNLAVSESGADDGYHVLLGTDLGSEFQNGRTIQVVASNGRLLTETLTGDEAPKE